MSVAPNAGIVDLDNFLPPTGGADGQQGQVPKPLAGQENHILSASGWVPGGGGGSGTVTSVAATAGTGIDVTGSPITTAGTLVITNTAPDQTVVLNSGSGIAVTGTYPNFTIANTSPSSGGTVTSVSGTTGRITSTGGTAPVLDLASGIVTAGTTGSATQVPVITVDTYGRVTSLTTALNPLGTVTSVSGTGAVNGISLSGTVTSNGSLTLGGALSGVDLASQVTGLLPVTNGGTNASTAGAARSNLGAAASGSNTDITSVALTTGTISTTPASSTDIVNKSYADSIASGVNFHSACQYGTTAALPANTYNNGSSGVGATLTAAAVGTLTIDGYTFVVGDVGKRILVKNEVTQANNGVYTLTQAGTALLPYILTRATDYDTSGAGTNEVDQGDLLLVLYGTANGNTSWVQQTPLPITVGTTALVFIQFAAVQTYTAGTGLTLTTNQFSITSTGTAGTYGSASSVPVITTNAQGQVTGVTPTSIAISGSAVSGNISGNAANVTGTVAIGNGGTGQTTQQSALNALAASTTSGSYLRGNGTNVQMSAIQAADVPTLNQATTGQAGSVANSLTAGTNITFSTGTTYNGSAAITINAASGALAKSTSVFTTGAAQTYTAPANTQWVKITVVGPGGTGGASATGRATGGGGGGVAIKWLSMTAGQTLVYTVGTASGTASTVASGTLTITTITANSGTNGANTTYAASITAGGAGGTATNGDVNITGEQGGYSFGSGTTITTNFGGKGGDCPGFGSGGPNLSMIATAGVQGNGFGAGGGGAHGSATAAAGRGGIIIFEAY